MKGVYRLYETLGLPLDLIIEQLFDQKLLVGWDEYYLEAMKAGVGHNKIMTRIEECLGLLKRLKQ